MSLLRFLFWPAALMVFFVYGPAFWGKFVLLVLAGLLVVGTGWLLWRFLRDAQVF